MIRPATAADLPRVAEIYDAILDREAETGVVHTNWKKGVYPCAETAKNIFDAGTLYVGEDNGIIWGSMNLNGVQLPEYARIPWSVPAQDEEVAVIHTLTIHPDHTGRGHARSMVAFAEETARATGKTVIRLDTWEHNDPANAMYPALGYRYAGATEFFFMGYIHEVLNLYEKAL